MTLLIAPGHNRTPRAVVRTAPGMVALDYTCVTKAVRWYTLAELEAVNGRAAVAAACKAPERVEHVIPDTDWPCALYVAPLTVQLTPEMMKHVNASAYVNLVTVWHPAMYNEAA